MRAYGIPRNANDPCPCCNLSGATRSKHGNQGEGKRQALRRPFAKKARAENKKIAKEAE